MSYSDAFIASMDQFVKRSQLPSGGTIQTPLAHMAALAGKCNSGDSDSGVNKVQQNTGLTVKNDDSDLLKLRESALNGLLILRANESAAELDNALASVLKLNLPARLSSQSAGLRYCIRWMSPDEWLMSCPLDEAFSIEKQLRDLIKGHIAIVNVSGGYTLLTLSGSNALQVLKKSTSYDVHPSVFNQGKVVNTVMAKAQVTLRAIKENHYEILVRRSFADYVCLWLQRAGQEYDLQFELNAEC